MAFMQCYHVVFDLFKGMTYEAAVLPTTVKKPTDPDPCASRAAAVRLHFSTAQAASEKRTGNSQELRLDLTGSIERL